MRRSEAVFLGSAVIVVAAGCYWWYRHRRRQKVVELPDERTSCEEKFPAVALNAEPPVRIGGGAPAHVTTAASAAAAPVHESAIDEIPHPPAGGIGPLERLLGPVLARRDGTRVATSSLEGKIVGLYFSAHWCKPCREFTPLLVTTYGELRSKHPFEIVFVSQCRDTTEFTEYFAEMPWLALPWDDREHNHLARRFKVTTLPTLALLSPEGRLLTRDGRAAVLADRRGERFPWRQRSLRELLQDGFVHSTGSGNPRLVGGLRKGFRVLGLYFAAGWSEECKQFTPLLEALWNKVNDNGQQINLEIVYVSGDRDFGMFRDMFQDMPWLAISFAHSKRREELTSVMHVNSMGPTLILVDESFRVITREGCAVVREDPDGQSFPWDVPDVVASSAVASESPCMLLFMEGDRGTDAATQVRLEADMTRLARELRDQAGDLEDDMPMHCFIAKRSNRAATFLRDLAGLDGDAATLVIVDIPDGGAYYVAEPKGAELSYASMKSFYDAWSEGMVERRQLRDSA